MTVGDPPCNCGCGCQPHPISIMNPNPSPRYLPVNVPLPEYSGEISIVTVDKEGNVTIKVGQVND